MRTPRRYRLALLAYPAAYRADRGPELAATLAEGDEERGRPSLRESGALVVGGLAMRARMLERPDWLLVATVFGVLEHPRRRRLAVVLAAPLALARRALLDARARRALARTPEAVLVKPRLG